MNTKKIVPIFPETSTISHEITDEGYVVNLKDAKLHNKSDFEEWITFIANDEISFILHHVCVDMMKLFSSMPHLLPKNYSIESFYIPLRIGENEKSILLKKGKDYFNQKKIDLNKIEVNGKKLVLYKDFNYTVEINNYLSPIPAIDHNRYECYSYLLDGIIVINEEKKIVYLNDYTCQLLQLSYKKTLKKRPYFYEEITLDSEELFCTKNGKKGKERSTYYREIIVKTNSGFEKLMQILITPDFNSFSQRKNWIVFLKDVSLEQSLTNKYKIEQRIKNISLNKLNNTKKELAVASDEAQRDGLTTLFNHKTFKLFLFC